MDNTTTHFTVTDCGGVIYHGDSCHDALTVYQDRREAYKPKYRANVRFFQSTETTPEGV